ncbi:MAG: serine protease [Sphingopyxis sp.]
MAPFRILMIGLLVTGLGVSWPIQALFAKPAAAPPAAPVAAPAPPARIDDVAATERSVVRVVTVAIVRGEVVGFGHGSGFAVAPNRIVTNAHVVSDAAEYPDNVVIGIVPSEGTRSYPGRLIRIDRARDLAIIEIVAGRIPAAAIYTGEVAQRQAVYALGYPGNVDIATAQNMDDFIRPRAPVASDGIISSHDSINGVAALVHDADIARGNSGGPLVDACGRVLGVNTLVTRAEEGDSPFAFAVGVRELGAFLREAGQSFTGVSSLCVSADEARARADARSVEDARAATIAEERARAAQASRDAEALDGLREAAQNTRENVMALAIALFGIAILCGAASFLYQSQDKVRERRIAIIAGAVLAGAALIAFVLRPSVVDVHVPRSDPAAATVDTAVTGAASARGVYGALTCRVDPARGRITVSATSDTALAITPQGCVNGRTQYVRGAGGAWSRTLVPNQDATVTRIAYDPATGQSTTRRYLLPLEAMEAVRRQRAAGETPACTQDAAILEALSRREAAIATLLPAEPNEEIVSACRAVAVASGADLPKTAAAQ